MSAQCKYSLVTTMMKDRNYGQSTRTKKKAKEIIEKVRQLDFDTVTIDSLRELLHPLLIGFQLGTPAWQVGQIFFRGRTMNVRPKKISELSYPPAPLVASHGRANRPGKPMFYCSVTRDPVFFELHVKPGDLGKR